MRQSIKDADDLVQKIIAQNPQSAALETMLGEVQYRAGMLWLSPFCEDAAKRIASGHGLEPHAPAPAWSAAVTSW